MRQKLLEEMVTTEKDLERLRALGPDEAKFRIDHERKMHIRWAEERHAFMTAECVIWPKPPTPVPTQTVKRRTVVDPRSVRGEKLT